MKAARLALVAAFGLSACAASNTQVLPAYQLANGQVLQDVVTIAADPSGGAPVITSVATYDLNSRAGARAVASASASGPGVGQTLAGAGGRIVGGVATIAAAEALSDGGGNTVNSVIQTAGNTATNGDAGDIDAQVVVCPGDDPICNPSN